MTDDGYYSSLEWVNILFYNYYYYYFELIWLDMKQNYANLIE